MKKVITSALCLLVTMQIFAQGAWNMALLSATATAPEPGDSIVEITPDPLGPLCPKRLIAGDRDFAGRGPAIKASVKITFNRNSVLALLNFEAKETKGGDNSETKGSVLKILYEAPKGYYIAELMSGKAAELSFVAPRAGTFSFTPGGLSKVLNVNAASVTDKNDGVVKSWEITGDTNGPDISDDDNCADDTRAVAILNKIKIKLKPTAAAQGISTITLENIDEWLCPSKLVRGDREFNGNGPRIKCEVKLRIGTGGTSLLADISFSASETVHDWSTTEGKWTKTVYEAPYGKKITEIISDKASRTQFISPPGGFQFIVPGHDVTQAAKAFFDNTSMELAVLKMFGLTASQKKEAADLVKGSTSNGNTVVRVPPTEGALVKFFHIVGDTGGDDISTDNNCNDDTRIVKLEFFPVRVKMIDAR
ncbi:MAG TPA: hypothetical protein PKC69_06810 [Chitinophagaceae bacterium]|nr:hypothetical protein [Chitinophagaceae bacterium]